MSSRLEFVELAQAPGACMALLCRRFNVSRKTGYKWLRRYRSGGEAALTNRSRRPERSPARTPAGVEQQVIKLRQKHRAWGGRKLAARLKALAVADVPSPSTITAILRRQDLLDAAEAQECQAIRRFVYPQANDLWQMDFKGHLALSAGGRCHPLTVLDDHSRYSLTLAACADERGATVQGHLISTFRHYGLPRRMLMDNGGPWGSCGASRVEPWTRFSLWLLRLNIQVIHGRPWHPQTQGKEERFHRTLLAEVLRWHPFADLHDVQKRLDPWRRIYNHERPHEALNMQVPAQHYQPSMREYPEELPAICYPQTDQVRQVRSNGRIRFESCDYAIGKAFTGQPVALRATRAEGLWDVYYCQQRIGQIDQRAGGECSLQACRPLAALASQRLEG
jgi:transposase InsO family protein